MKKVYLFFILIFLILNVNIVNATNINTNNMPYLKIMRLDIPGMEPEFNKNVMEYYLSVNENINDIDVTAIPEYEDNIVNIKNNKNLKKGLNKVEIEVINKSSRNSNFYFINVVKTNDLKKANANLENLAIENAILNPEFDKTKMKYDVTAKSSIDKLNILAIPENENSTVKIIGNDNLEYGQNMVIVQIIAEDGIGFKNYIINVYKNSQDEDIAQKKKQEYEAERVKYILEKNENNKKNYKEFLTILIISVLLILVIGMIMLFG